jgi:hypothetical protein
MMMADAVAGFLRDAADTVRKNNPAQADLLAESADYAQALPETDDRLIRITSVGMIFDGSAPETWEPAGRLREVAAAWGAQRQSSRPGHLLEILAIEADVISRDLEG